MKRELPPSLIQKQEQMRQQTIEKVLRAMKDLKAEGCRINIKNLMAYSGLSRSVFAKPHVRDLIQDQLAAKEQKTTPKRRVVRKNQQEEIAAYISRINRLSEENEQLKKECELLRGGLFLLMNKMDR